MTDSGVAPPTRSSFWSGFVPMGSRVSVVLLYNLWDMHFDGLRWVSTRNPWLSSVFALLAVGLTNLGAIGFRTNPFAKLLIVATSSVVMGIWVLGFFVSPDPILVVWPWIDGPALALAIFVVLSPRRIGNARDAEESGAKAT